MLALRLVLAGGPPIKVFDEVDAGIGGETARAVGEALSSLGAGGQVFVVTHLAQVASYADNHVLIDKSTEKGSTSSQARVLNEEERVVEVSRMLSGSPDSSSAHEHAEELLAATSSNREQL
jgi:DNA repair protein RecN (Recombination protein N)